MVFDPVVNNDICQYLVKNVVPMGLVMYSHIPTTIIALFMGIFVFRKGEKTLSSKLLLAVTSLYAVWTLSDLVLWTNYDTRAIMFFWSPLGLISMLLYACALWFSYVFLTGRDISFAKKATIFAPIVPMLVLAGTHWNLDVFDGFACEAVENHWFVHYSYGYDLFIILWIAWLAIATYRDKLRRLHRKQVVVFALGMEFFLVLFYSAGYVASLTDIYQLDIYSLFGMPFFVALLAYLIVKYKAFNIRLLGVQALVVTIILLIGAQFFFVKTHTNLILTSVTFVLVALASGLLVKSFEDSERRKDELQVIAKKLAATNRKLREVDKQKTEFLSIASHQLRTPLTSIKGYTALLLDGSFGELVMPVKEALKRIVISNERLVNLVENLLSVSRMDEDRMQYQPELCNAADMLRELESTFSIVAQNKHLELIIHYPDTPVPDLYIDRQKMIEVYSNLMDNAIKYTKVGEVSVTLEYIVPTDMVRVTVKDSGIGIPADEIPLLFQKFSRGKDTERLHAGGTGLGLYVAKNIVEAHNGTIIIESEGEGKGSSFVVDLPVENSIEPRPHAEG